MINVVRRRMFSKVKATHLGIAFMCLYALTWFGAIFYSIRKHQERARIRAVQEEPAEFPGYQECVQVGRSGWTCGSHNAEQRQYQERIVPIYIPGQDAMCFVLKGERELMSCIHYPFATVNGIENQGAKEIKR
jgi:hypothetical protein